MIWCDIYIVTTSRSNIMALHYLSSYSVNVHVHIHSYVYVYVYAYVDDSSVSLGDPQSITLHTGVNNQSERDCD